ncbi:hypothetical protein SLEP1_g45787 [Rubroshorea leprosula]|nr:hypothetical protein SLEP1_g45787 [Rubroshorea leprosula]
MKVLKALEAVLGQLRKFLVDHTVVPIFEKTYAAQISQERTAPADTWVDRTQPSLHSAPAQQAGIASDYSLSLKWDPLFERETHLEPKITQSGLSLFGDRALGVSHSTGLSRAAAPIVTQSADPAMGHPSIYSREDGVKSPEHRGRDPDRRWPDLDNQRSPTPERVEGHRTCKNKLYKNTKQHKQPKNTKKPKGVIGKGPRNRQTSNGHRRKPNNPEGSSEEGAQAGSTQPLKHQNLGSSKASNQNKRSAGEKVEAREKGEKRGGGGKRVPKVVD